MISVLYVDDETSLLELCRRYLVRKGDFSVETHSSAHTALERLKSATFDAVVSDYQMPGMNGIELLHELRASGNTVPFIIFTGRGREEAAIQALNEGADFYLQKGGDTESLFVELAHVVTSAVEKHRAYEAVRRNEEQLRVAHQRTASILEAIVDTFFSLDTEWRFTMMNSAAEKAPFGMPASELLGKCIWDLFPALNETPVKERFLQVARTGSVTEFVIRSSLNGRYYEVFAQDSADGIDVCMRDITDKKEAEIALKESEERFRLLLHDSSDPIFSFFPDGTYQYVNRAFAEGVGRKVEEITGRRIWDVFSKEEADMRFSALHSVFLTGVGREIEVRVPRPDGDRFYLTTITPVTDGQGTVITAICISKEITARKKAEAALQESEESFRSLAESSQDIILRFDQAGKVLYMNRAGLAVFHLTPQELIGKSFWEAGPDEAACRLLMEKVGGVFLTGEAARVPLFLPGPKGTVFLDGLVVPEPGPENPVRSVLAVLRDITDLHTTTARLLKANHQLGLMTTVMGHDIRNKAMAIRGALDLAREPPKNPAMDRSIAVIDEAADAILSQVGFLNRYQELGVRGPGWQSPERIILGLSLPPGVSLECSLNGTEVYADPLFREVFSNLLDNSLRHGDGVTRIRVFSRISPQGLILVWEDDGCGVPGGEKEQVFLRGVGRNTGLGLFLVAEVLGVTGMTIAETGEHGSGARFEIRVPDGAYRVAQAGDPS